MDYLRRRIKRSILTRETHERSKRFSFFVHIQCWSPFFLLGAGFLVFCVVGLLLLFDVFIAAFVFYVLLVLFVWIRVVRLNKLNCALLSDANVIEVARCVKLLTDTIVFDVVRCLKNYKIRTFYVNIYIQK
jgi:glycerol-3-phosphate acyltransferase PlsY